MKKIMLILFLAACFSFQMYAESLADENKTITPQEFATTLSEVPNKVGNFLTSEVEKTKYWEKLKNRFFTYYNFAFANAASHPAR